MKERENTDETYVRLLLSYHDRSLEIDMNNDKQFMVTRLEEEMFDVTEEYICDSS
jgi:hypothetical protein